MEKQQKKDIVHDVISASLAGAGAALWLETAVFSSEGKKLSMIGRDTFIGGLIGGAIGFVAGLIFHGKSAIKTERLAREKAISDVKKDATGIL